MKAAVPLSTLRKIAAEVGYPTDKTCLVRRLRREGATPITGSLDDGKKGFLFREDELPAIIAARLPRTASVAPASILTAAGVPPTLKRDAERRVRMMLRLRSLLSGDLSATAAYAEIAAEFEVSVPTVKRAWKAVRTADEGDWLDLLVKGYKGRKPDELDTRVWSAFLADYGRVEQPQLQATWERIGKLAKREGWGDIPSVQTFKRRWNALSAAERVYMRNGEKALGQLFPYAERDRSGMKPNEGFNIDGRTWDVFVQMPDGRVIRPTVSMVQDEATNYLLSWIVGESESGDMYRRVLCDTFSKFGIPSRVLFDNTRAAANKMLTAGAKNRNRFKDNIADIEGILPRVGCDPQFALPENGQSKLVERGFGEIKERSEKDPRLAGAYAGRSPSEKPANYGERAVPLALFKTVLAEAVEHYNARVDRRGKVAFKTSHRALYETGVKAIKVRRLTKAQERLFFMIAERRTLTPDGSVQLGKRPHVNRFWSEALQAHRGEEVVVRFDPDDLAAPVLVETLDGRLIDGAVPIIEKRGFRSMSDAREHSRAKRAYAKRAKQNVADLKRLASLEHAGDVLVPETSEAPIAPVIAPDFKRKSAKPAPAPSIDTDRIRRAADFLEQHSRYG